MAPGIKVVLEKRRQKAQRVELVVWDDAVADAGWKDSGDAEKPQRCHSIGLVVVDDRRSIVLAGSWGANANGKIETNNRITIPKGFIVSRTAISLVAK